MSQHGWKFATLVLIPVAFILGWLGSRWSLTEKKELAERLLVQSKELPSPVVSQSEETPREVIEVIDLAQVFEPGRLPLEISGNDPSESSTSSSVLRAFHEELIETGPYPRVASSRNRSTGEEESDVINSQLLPWYYSIWPELMNRIMPLKGSAIPEMK